MSTTIDDIKKEWNPDAIYDFTDIKEHARWEYYFTKLFPECEFTACWVGRLKKIEGKLSTREGSRLLFMQRTEERFRTFRLQRDMFTFRFQDGKISMFIVPAISIETRAKLEEEHLAGKDWLEIMYGQKYENKEDECEGCGIKGRCPVEPEKNEVIVTFESRTFEELNLVTAREFTQEEIQAIDNAVKQKEIEKKHREIEELEAAIK